MQTDTHQDTQTDMRYNYTFKGLLELNLLDISKNRITDIDSDAFSHFMKLNTLYLRNNKIKSVKDVWFRNMSELELIDLSHNLIQSFVPSYF